MNINTVTTPAAALAELRQCSEHTRAAYESAERARLSIMDEGRAYAARARELVDTLDDALIHAGRLTLAVESYLRATARQAGD